MAGETVERDAVLLHDTDNVATALRALGAGHTARVQAPGGMLEVHVAEDIALCHKLAVRALAAGEAVRKYGEVIGTATAAVPAGGWVHVHNLVSLRGRGAAGG